MGLTWAPALFMQPPRYPKVSEQKAAEFSNINKIYLVLATGIVPVVPGPLQSCIILPAVGARADACLLHLSCRLVLAICLADTETEAIVKHCKRKHEQRGVIYAGGPPAGVSVRCAYLPAAEAILSKPKEGRVKSIELTCVSAAAIRHEIESLCKLHRRIVFNCQITCKYIAFFYRWRIYMFIHRDRQTRKDVQG